MRIARFLLLGLAGHLLAANPPAQTAPPAPVVEIEFTVFATGRMPDLVFISSDKPGAAPVPLSFNTAQRSSPHRYRGPLPLVFYRPDPAAPGGLSPAARLLAPPATPGPLLLVFHHHAAANGAFLLLAYPDSLSTLPPRHLNILNLSGQSLAAEFNGRPLPLPAGLTPSLHVGDKGKLRVAISTHVGWKPAYSQDLQIEENERGTLVLLPPPSATRPLLPSRLLIERVETPPPAPSAAPAS
jgi:hypothetical protein